MSLLHRCWRGSPLVRDFCVLLCLWRIDAFHFVMYFSLCEYNQCLVLSLLFTFLG
jgi:hypothetical protein